MAGLCEHDYDLVLGKIYLRCSMLDMLVLMFFVDAMDFL